MVKKNGANSMKSSNQKMVQKTPTKDGVFEVTLGQDPLCGQGR